MLRRDFLKNLRMNTSHSLQTKEYFQKTNLETQYPVDDTCIRSALPQKNQFLP